MKKLLFFITISALTHSLYAQVQHDALYSHRFMATDFGKHLEFVFSTADEININANMFGIFNFTRPVKAPEIHIPNVMSSTRVFSISNIDYGDVFSIYGNGSVGIGIKIPQQKLHVVGNSFFDGNVGIGTATVDNTYGWHRVLDICGKDHAKLLIRNSTVKTGIFSHDVWMGTPAGIIGTESNHDLILMANYGNRVMTLKTNGNVGIGMHSPSEKLHVCNGSLKLGAPIIGPTYDKIKFGDGDYVQIGEWEGDDILSFYARSGHSFRGGNVYANGVLLTSDERLKANIRPLFEETDKLYLLQGKSYKKTSLPKGFEKDISAEKSEIAEKNEITEFSEYGYLAQELKEVFPDLVSQDNQGYYSVNYIGLIPIIVEALKDQKQTIETQQKDNTQQQKEIKVLQDIVFSQEKDLNEMQNKMEDMQKIVMNCCENTNNNHKSNNDNIENNNTQSQIQKEAVLYQNVPNPFSSNTEISCDIPASFSNAVIYVYNLQGVELMSFPIKQTGLNKVIVSASVLPAGMYLYTLVVDNVIIDTKRMILTK